MQHLLEWGPYVMGLILALYPLLFVAVGCLYVSKKRRVYAHQRRHLASEGSEGSHAPVCIGVFHPYANGGGGGERVLYCALAALVREDQARNPKRPGLRVLLYSGDDGLSAANLLSTAAERFNLPELVERRVESYVTLVPLSRRELLEPERYPRFTLFWQSLAHVRLARDAFAEGERRGLYPSMWIDTTGCAFSYVLARMLYGCRVVAYVHYPMISTDMIDKVAQRAADYNNPSQVALSPMRSTVKLWYYRLFARAYGLVGRYCVDVAMVNSTWTFNHIRALWGGQPLIVYPPCGSMDEYLAFDLKAREPIVLSISQFRPEKNQRLQLETMQLLRTKYRVELEQLCPDLRLVLLGSCRNPDDEARVALLREQCADLGITSHVDFVVNASFAELKRYLARASMGIHTMYNEHFGISIVEMMAAGMLVVANNSGGPAADIVKAGTGHLALTAEEYADKILTILRSDKAVLEAMRERARASSSRFSDGEFGQQFLAAMATLRR